MKPATFLRLFSSPLLLAATLFLPLLATAQTAPLVTQPVDPAQRQTLGQTVHPLVKNSIDSGRADSALPMKDMLLKLNSSADQSTLKQYIASLHNPNSATFHKWLTPEQYAQKFGAADADVSKVSAWLQSSGFKVEQVARSKGWIRFSGTASQVESAFQTQIHEYSLQTGSTTEKHYANASALSIPAALSPAVAGVVSMNNFFTSPEHATVQTMKRGSNGKMTFTPTATFPTRSSSPAPELTTGAGANYVTPGDFSAIYGAQSVVASGITGSGVSIAVVGRSDISISDVEAFRTITGLPFNDPTITYATTDPGDISGDDVEASLDVEWSGAIAPQANINYVIGASTTTTDGVDISSSYIVDNVVAPIMTISFGNCEANTTDAEIAFYQTLWQQASAEGITVLIAAGDSGASGCNDPNDTGTQFGFGVNALASTSYNLAVGGTEFSDLTAQDSFWNSDNTTGFTSAKGYIPEAIWNESCQNNVVPGQDNCLFPPYTTYSYAGGGGPSACVTRTTDEFGDEYCAAGEPKPAWQQGTGVPNDGVRDLPDISLAAAAAHDPFLFCYQGDCQFTNNSDGSVSLDSAGLVGGTSDAAPAMASILALVEQKTSTFQGVVNYQLYSLAANQSNSCNSSNRTDPTQAATCVFNDITSGSNAVPCFSGNQDCDGVDQPVQVGVSIAISRINPNAVTDGQVAGTGFDLATGLGSVNVANLVNAWGKSTQAASKTTLNLSQTTFQHGSSINLTGVVAAASGTGTPTGDVVINVSTGNAVVLSIPVSSGSFSGSTINLPGGTYNVTAGYAGDMNYAPSTSSPVSITVTPENSAIASTSFAYSHLLSKLSSAVLLQTNNVNLGLAWFLQFNVAGVSGANGATGSITLTAGTKTVGTYTLGNDGGIYVTCGAGTGCDFPVGTVNFTATYSGDASYKPSTTTYQFTVNPGKPFWAVTGTNPFPTANSTVFAYFALSAVADPSIPPTGTVSFTRNDTGAALGSATIDATGVATISFNVGEGIYNIVPQWAGDANYVFDPGNSEEDFGVVTESTPGTTPVKISFNMNGSSFVLGQAATYTVTVVPTQPNSAMPVGYVQLWAVPRTAVPTGEGVQLNVAQTLSLAGGKVTGVIPWTAPGPLTLYVTYEGDATFGGGSSSTIPVTVAQGTPTLAVQTNSTYVGIGTTTSVTTQFANPLAGLGVAAPTGTVQFFNSLNGGTATPIGAPQLIVAGNGLIPGATLATTLPAGSNAITAVYSGDGNWKTASAAAPAAVVVTSPDFSFTPPTGPVAVSAGQSESIALTTQSILGYNTPIVVTCGTLPVGVTCNSSTITPGAYGTITLTTTAPGTTTSTQASNQDSVWKTSGRLAMAGLLLFWLPRRSRTLRYLATVLLALGLSAAGLTGCSSGGSSLPPTLSITSSNTKAASGTAVTFQATASSGSTNGSVTFYSDTVALGQSVALANGVATLNTSSLSIGTHAITAKYTSDDNSASSASSDTIQQSITGSFTLTLTGTSGTATHAVNVPVTLN